MPKAEPIFNKTVRNIGWAWGGVSRHPRQKTKGVDGVSIEDYKSGSKQRLSKLRERLRDGSFHFSKLKPVPIPKKKGGTREIKIATVDDRIVSRALLKSAAAKFKKFSTESSYCPVLPKQYRKVAPFYGVPLAAKKIQDYFAEGYSFVFETDIKSFFASINKKAMLKLIEKEIPEKKTLALVEEIIQFEVSGMDYQLEEEIGLAEGSPLSPLFANLFLYEFDNAIEKHKDVKLVRYVDDLVVLCKSEARAKEMEKIVTKALKDLKLEIHSDPKKTGVKDAKKVPILFLGLQFNFRSIVIPKGKKEEFLAKASDILRSPGTVLEKISSIRNRLKGFADQYRKPHYNTKDDINFVVNRTQQLVEQYHWNLFRGIFHASPYPTDDKAKIARYLEAFGFDFQDLLVK